LSVEVFFRQTGLILEAHDHPVPSIVKHS